MDQFLRELCVSRIVAGEFKCRVRDQTLYVRNPDRRQRYRGNELYKETLDNARLQGILHDDETLQILTQQKLWSSHDADQHEKLIKAIEEQKVGLYENRLLSNARSKLRFSLQKGKDELVRLEGIKHSLDHITCSGLAIQMKYRYLLGCGVYRENGEPLWRTEDDWNRHDAFLDEVYDQILSERLTEVHYRELVRSEPWKSLWASRKFCGRGVFDVASVDLSDDQRSLLIWSSVYESIYDHPECPPESVIEDDDMLDGWMIIQRRKREGEQIRGREREIKSEKIKNAHEIMFPADNIEDAREIERMNDAPASMIKQQRMNLVKQKGEVSELHMPDTWQRFMMECATAEAKNLRGQ
jgi:hypothetical protein